ncbi:MAG: hypothetical protein EOO05_04570 [Chitinophagaceae bacterium]|nr:MAG: hypothetical protein EOO05_04570 [Chitinophagaceae bacterium]
MMQPGAVASPSQLVRVLKVLSIAMMCSLVIYLVAAVIMNEMNGPLMVDLNNYHTTLLAVVMLIAFACLVIGKRVMAKGIGNAKNSLNPLEAKLNIYRGAFIINLALLEVPGWLTLTVYLLTGSFPFLALAAVLLGLMIATWPGVKRISSQLELDWNDQQLLNK